MSQNFLVYVNPEFTEWNWILLNSRGPSHGRASGLPFIRPELKISHEEKESCLKILLHESLHRSLHFADVAGLRSTLMNSRGPGHGRARRHQRIQPLRNAAQAPPFWVRRLSRRHVAQITFIYTLPHSRNAKTSSDFLLHKAITARFFSPSCLVRALEKLTRWHWKVLQFVFQRPNCIACEARREDLCHAADLILNQTTI